MPRIPTSELSISEKLGDTAIADGVPEVLRTVREQLRKGASQIKVAMGGGISSTYDPIDVVQYTDAEIRAAVDAAKDWNTYVMVHAYTPRSMQRSIRAGVKSIEHGHLMDEETAKLMAEKDAWLSIQPFVEDDAKYAPNQERFLQVVEGTDKTYKLAKKYHLKTAFGTDILLNPDLAQQQGAQLVKLLRWYTPVEILKMATSVNGELFALSGPRNPYPGKLGVVEEGALADLLLVDGNPLEDIGLITDPEKNFVVIMKDGKIYKSDSAFTQ
nr:amidohydrolase family protein [Okeania sp. SIO2C2]